MYNFEIRADQRFSLRETHTFWKNALLLSGGESVEPKASSKGKRSTPPPDELRWGRRVWRYAHARACPPLSREHVIYMYIYIYTLKFFFQHLRSKISLFHQRAKISRLSSKAILSSSIQQTCAKKKKGNKTTLALKPRWYITSRHRPVLINSS